MSKFYGGTLNLWKGPGGWWRANYERGALEWSWKGARDLREAYEAADGALLSDQGRFGVLERAGGLDRSPGCVGVVDDASHEDLLAIGEALGSRQHLLQYRLAL